MSLKTKFGVVLLIICMLALELYVGVINSKKAEEETAVYSKDTIVLWYTDDTLTDFLNSVALAYYEDTDVHVELKLVSGLEYLENINYASTHNGEKPDLYIVGNDLLGKAYRSGLAVEVLDSSGILNAQHYSQPALDAVTYEGKYVGYPMYFETSYLLYNATYLEQVATSEMEELWAQNEAQEGAEGEEEPEEDAQLPDEELEGEEVSPYADDPKFQEAVRSRVMELVPLTIDDILDFADQYDAPGNVDAIFEWDVSDIFYNYFFVGNYVEVGGPAGDDPEKFDIYNENAIRCLNVYQALNQFFSIDADLTYEEVIQDFMEGKTVFTLATTDAIARLEQAKADGTFVYDYGVAMIPDLTDELQAREVSYTNAIAINGYSDKKAQANAFAKYICLDHADSLYGRTGKVASSMNVIYENGAIDVILMEYAATIPMPKVVEASNFWIELEMCFTNVWLGEDANRTLRRLSEKIMKQIMGKEYMEEYIEVPVEEIDETKYEDTGMEDIEE